MDTNNGNQVDHHQDILSLLYDINAKLREAGFGIELAEDDRDNTIRVGLWFCDDDTISMGDTVSDTCAIVINFMETRARQFRKMARLIRKLDRDARFVAEVDETPISAEQFWVVNHAGLVVHRSVNLVAAMAFAEVFKRGCQILAVNRVGGTFGAPSEATAPLEEADVVTAA